MPGNAQKPPDSSVLPMGPQGPDPFLSASPRRSDKLVPTILLMAMIVVLIVAVAVWFI